MISCTPLRQQIIAAACFVLSLAFACPLQAQVVRRIEISAASTPVRLGVNPVGTAMRGQTFDILDQSGNWYRISINGKEGWVAAADVRLVETFDIAPLPTTHVLVTADSAPIVLGEKTLGTVRRGQVLPIVGRSAAWIKVLDQSSGAPIEGYLKEPQVRLLDATEAGLSQGGLAPESISDATIAVDWEAERVTIRATVPRSGDAALRLVPPVDSNSALPLPEIVQTGDRVEITGTIDEILRTLSPGTRSMWLQEVPPDNTGVPVADVAGASIESPLAGPTGHRVDLPGPQAALEVDTYDFPTFTEGLVVAIPVRNLLPGYVVEFAESTGAPFGSSTPMSRTKGTLPRLVDLITPPQGPPIVRIAIPRTSDTQRTWYRIGVGNPDGSRSAYVAFGRSANQVDRKATVSLAATEIPVDSTVVAPPLELLSVSEAIARAKAAGLSPKFVEDGTYVEVAQPASDAMVVQQGIEPGERAIAGQSLVLAVENAAPDIDERLVTRGGLVDTSMLSDTQAIDTADDLNFVDIQQTGLVGLGDNSDSATDTVAIDDSTLDSQLIDGGGLINDLADDPLNNNATPGGIVPGGNTTLPIDSDPGVNIDPQADDARQLLAAILKLLLEAILRQSNSQNLPGPVGGSISDAVQQFEKELLAALQRPYDATAAAESAGEMFDLVTRHLGLTVAAADRQAAVDEWSQHAAVRWNALQIDRNMNGRVADDVAIWHVIWLFQHGHFDPATAVTLASGADGTPLAVVPDKPQPADWLKLLKLPPISPLHPNLVIPPANANNTKPPADNKKKKLPEGKAVVTTSSVPDEVRVPDMEDQFVSRATRQLNELGLRVGDASSLFDSDKVVDSTPAAGTWQRTGTAVDLEVHRRVPSVTRLQLTDADARIKQWRLRWTTDGETYKGDVVTGQEPAAGTYIPLDQAIDLDLSAVVPHVVGMQQSDAASKLSEFSLNWASDTRAFSVDRVVSQDPTAGVLVPHGEKVSLVLHLPVPNVTGISLARAREILTDWDLFADVPNGSAHDADTVRGQNPRAGTYVPHRSDTRLSPIVAIVPDVRGMEVGSATRRLRDDEDFAVGIYGDLIDEDIVTMQNPAAGTELERGNRITLDARVQVPNVYQRPILDARDTINAAAGNLRAVIVADLARTDVVYSQSPRAGEWVFPRTSVELVPGVYVPQLSGMSTSQADDALRAVSLRGRITSSGTQPTTNRVLFDQVRIDGQSPNPGLYDRRTVDEVRLSAVRYIPDLRDVPFVVEMRVSEAVSRINAAGLRAEIVEGGRTYTPQAWAAKELVGALGSAIAGNNETDYVEPYVVRQSPQGGERVLAGSTVSIAVGGHFR